MASSSSRKRSTGPAEDETGVSETFEKKQKTCGSLPRFEGMSLKRCRPLNDVKTAADVGGGDVLYWMSRDQRVQGEPVACLVHCVCGP